MKRLGGQLTIVNNNHVERGGHDGKTCECGDRAEHAWSGRSHGWNRSHRFHHGCQDGWRNSSSAPRSVFLVRTKGRTAIPELSPLSIPRPHLRTHGLIYLKSIWIETWRFAQKSNIALSQHCKRTFTIEGPCENIAELCLIALGTQKWYKQGSEALLQRSIHPSGIGWRYTDIIKAERRQKKGQRIWLGRLRELSWERWHQGWWMTSEVSIRRKVGSALRAGGPAHAEATEAWQRTGG